MSVFCLSSTPGTSVSSSSRFALYVVHVLGLFIHLGGCEWVYVLSDDDGIATVHPTPLNPFPPTYTPTHAPQGPRHGARGGVGVHVERLALLAHADGRDDRHHARGQQVADDLFVDLICGGFWGRGVGGEIARWGMGWDLGAIICVCDVCGAYIYI